MKISVAMAVYNGQKYIKEQINSILTQLNDNDEIIVSLDVKTDKTIKILWQMQKDDNRIKIVNFSGSGVINNFENAIKHSTGEIIFLSDQDDVWHENKVKTVLECFEDNVVLVLHDAYITDENLNDTGESYFNRRNSSENLFKNILKNSFVGCCMALKRELLNYAMPFPKNLPMHDQWLGLVAIKYFKVKLCDKKLIYHRRHGENTSKLEHSSIMQILKWRINIIKNLYKNLPINHGEEQ